MNMNESLNPFSSRFVKPGAQSFVFSSDDGLNKLIARLEQANWRGEVVGPHGCGKSTLLATLGSLVNRKCLSVAIHFQDDHTEKYDSLYDQLKQLDSDHLLIIDGFEQFDSQQRSNLLVETQKRQVGILVSCHESVGLPTLLNLKPDLDRFREVVDRLLTGRAIRPSNEEIVRAFHKYEPNLREALFSLYDIYEYRRREPQA